LSQDRPISNAFFLTSLSSRRFVGGNNKESLPFDEQSDGIRRLRLVRSGCITSAGLMSSCWQKSRLVDSRCLAQSTQTECDVFVRFGGRLAFSSAHFGFFQLSFA